MNATRVTVSTFGTLAGLAGIEHGIGEVLLILVLLSVAMLLLGGGFGPPILGVTLSAFGFLQLTIVTGFGHDIQRKLASCQFHPRSR